MKNTFKISQEEKNRILGLHESYKTTQGGRITEQAKEVVVDEKNNPNYEKEKTELENLGYEKTGVIDSIDDRTQEDGYETEVLYDTDGKLWLFTRKKTDATGWENNNKNDNETKPDNLERFKSDSTVRDDDKIQKAKRDFDAYYNSKISGQQINIYSDKKSRDKQSKEGGIFTKGLIDSVTLAKPSRNNPEAIRNKKNQIVGIELFLTDDKGSIRYKCASDLNKLESSVQYLNSSGKSGGFGKEFIGPKEFVSVAMKTLCSKLQIYSNEMSKVPATSKF